jgi:pimeloyl-[acyl-carrier protein] methyl ester esterase
MPTVTGQDGTPIYYRDLGAGRPLVLLHGWCMSAQVWEPLFPLAEGCRLLLPDLRGHGSSAPVSPFDLNELAADTVSLFRGLDLRDAVLGGWSLGSLTALAALPHIRDRLSGLVLLGGTARFTAAEGYLHGLPSRELRGMSLRLRRDYPGTLESFVRGMFAEGELSVGERDIIAARLMEDAPDAEVALAGLEVLAASDLRSTLGEIDLPACIIHGDEDRVCPAAAGRYLAERISRSRLALLPDVGHAPFISRPDLVIGLLDNFIKECA